MTLRPEFILLAGLCACAAPSAQPHEPVASVKPDAQIVHHLDDPDLDRPPPPKLLAIDWSADADPLALWNQIAPTPDDWQERLAEVPTGELQRKLATSLLRQGNFACIATTPSCGRAATFPPVKSDARLTDPCFRRQLALWAFDHLEPEDVPALKDALKQIAALPAPESELVAAAIHAAEGQDQDFRLELVAAMKKAHQDELADTAIAGLDDVHLIAAAKLHVDGALEALPAATQRPVFLQAVTDHELRPDTRIQAMSELIGDDDKLGSDLQTTLVAATKAPSCRVAAGAAILLSRHGNRKLVPTRGTYPTTNRGLCVLAAYEGMMRGDESSPLPSYLPKHGLEYVRVTYDPYSDTDTDGDGDIHTERTTKLIDRDFATLPDADIVGAALAGCTKTTCETDDHIVRLTLRGAELVRLEIVDKPPC